MTWSFWPFSGLFAAATALLAKVGVADIDFEPLVRIAMAMRGAGDP